MKSSLNEMYVLRSEICRLIYDEIEIFTCLTEILFQANRNFMQRIYDPLFSEKSLPSRGVI